MKHNPTDLDINEWQELLYEFRASNPRAQGSLAMRIENTLYSIARFYGGMVLDGHTYTYFEPRIPDTGEVAWLVVRDDFLKWVSKRLKERKDSNEP